MGPRKRERKTDTGLRSPATCNVVGCGRTVRIGRGCLYCAACVERPTSLARTGPADENELDVTVAGLTCEVERGGDCAHSDCGQPTLKGRLYCSDRCRARARFAGQAVLVIDGVAATLREHARARGINIKTAWDRMARGRSPEEAVMEEPRAQMRRSRVAA